MSVFDDFDLLLADFNKVEERIFLRNINEFAEENKDVVIRTYFVLLKSSEINIQLRYLVLKSIGELRYKEFVPLLALLLEREEKIRIIYEAVNSLVQIKTLPAYKAIVHFLDQKAAPEMKITIESGLKDLFNKNKLLFHFDVFYRQRGDIKSLDKNADALIKNLPDKYIKDILPAISSRYFRIRYEVMRILKNRPNPIFYSTIYNYFKQNATRLDEGFFLLVCETLVANAVISKMGNKIFSALREHLDRLKEDKRIVLAIVLLRLDTAAMIDTIESYYFNLSFDRKMLIFENINREVPAAYLGFIRKLLVDEDNERLLERVIQLMIFAKDFDYLFRILSNERPRRKETVLGIVLDYDPPGIGRYIEKYIDPSSSNNLLTLSLEYILRHAADNYFDLVKKVFFSGVSSEVKTCIIRSLTKFSVANRKVFLEMVLDDSNTMMVNRFKKDFLFSFLAVMNEKNLPAVFEDRLLNRILILLEEAGDDEIVNFIYFFDKYEINNNKDMDLIIDELRMIQNTLLKSSEKGELVRMIHVLIKNIEKKVKEKELKMKRRETGRKK